MNAQRLKRWWSPVTGSGDRATSRPRQPRRSLRIFRVALALVSVGLLTYFSPSQRPYSITDLRVGSVAPERINAPLPFYVRKSVDELDAERLQAERSIPTVLIHDTQTGPAQLTYLDSVFGVLLPNLRMQMPDSLKHSRLQRELPDVIGSLSEAALRQLSGSVARLGAPELTEFVAASHQVLSDVYATGILASREGPLTRVTPQIRIGESELSISSVHEKLSLQRGELLSLIQGYRPLVGGLPLYSGGPRGLPVLGPWRTGDWFLARDRHRFRQPSADLRLLQPSRLSCPATVAFPHHYGYHVSKIQAG